MTGLLVADIGGTGSRLAVLDGDRYAVEPVEYRNSRYPSFDEVMADFLPRLDTRPARMAIAAAGPVSDNRVRLTNLGWVLSAGELATTHGIERVEIINDFAALAWATLWLRADELRQVGGGNAMPQFNRAILGPGTGLGVSGLISAGDDWAVMAGEGGHVTMPAVTPAEADLIAGVLERYGHCSAERLLSGPGLAYIYAANGGPETSPEQITGLALDGDALALRTVNIFCELLGTVASDLALTTGARGGVYLAGGMLPAIVDLFAASGFRERFEAKARFKTYLEQIPVYVITRAFPGFVGLNGFMRSRAA